MCVNSFSTQRARWAAAAFAAVLLAGCASYGGRGLRPGVDGAAEIRATMGEPAMVWTQPDGGATWEYPRGPEGRDTFMVRIGADGKLREIRQVLDLAVFETIVPNRTTRDEVRRLVGRPYREMQFPRVPEWVWEYRYLEGSTPMLFYVGFDARGVVRDMFRTVEHRLLEEMSND